MRKLKALDGKTLDGLRISLKNLSSGKFQEEINFDLFLKKEEKISEEPVVHGKYFSGRREYGPWIEVYFNKIVRFSKNKKIDMTENMLDELLFVHFSDILPPGSHMMVVYSNHEETKEALSIGVPAAATYIGYLLFRSGFTWFKDWYFAEGFKEGDVKLQGEKASDEERRKEDIERIERELRDFLAEEKSQKKLIIDAKKRAEKILSDVGKS